MKTKILWIIWVALLSLQVTAQSISRLSLEESTDLKEWQEVALTPAMIDSNGKLIVPTDGTERFYRMQVEFVRPPSLSAQPNSTTVVSGNTATLTVTATGTGPFSYQWYEGAVGTTTAPVGANLASFTTPALTATTSYWVRVSNALGGINSSLATVTVGTAPSITTQPSSTTIASGQTATLTLTASGSAPLTYQWYRGAVGATEAPVGTNSASFTTPALTATTSYWVRASNAVGGVNSSIATVTVESNTPADLALIPAGSFTMGRTSGDTDTYAPPVTVTLNAFYIGKNEVTKALWDEIRSWAVANGYTDLAAGAGKDANHPVQTVSWWDVVKWCNARSEREGLTPSYTVDGQVFKTGTAYTLTPTVNWTANGYRLPTEAEWEKAARGGVSGKRFPWGGDTISHDKANFNNNGIEPYRSGTTGFHPVYATGSTPYTSPVGSFAANGYGLRDIEGNVSEWCWHSFYFYQDGLIYPHSGDDYNRMSRGGSWADQAVSCRAADRSGSASLDGGYISIGFRVSRSTINISTSPGVIIQPTSRTISSGDSTTLWVTSSGSGPFNYQWYQGIAGQTNNPIGTNSSLLTTPTLSATTSYWVKITNSSGSINSSLATITVVNQPAIKSHPNPKTINPSETTTLSVSAVGKTPLSYQWYKGLAGDTSKPVGTNSPSFTTPSLNVSETYWLRVSNSSGQADSNPATVTVEVVSIPAGIFTMGRTSSDSSDAELADAPPVSVTVGAFYIGTNEVTSSKWREVRAWAIANGYNDLSEIPYSAAYLGREAMLNLPATGMNWYDAVKWCNAYSQMKGFTPCYTVNGAVMKRGKTIPAVNWTANGYRLPTEAEWEKAARGGVGGKRFPWGTDTITHSNANYTASPWWSYDLNGSTTWTIHPLILINSDGLTDVGTFAPNSFGLNDMAGNVVEWCWDGYDQKTYSTGASNPRGPSGVFDRVLRGGSSGDMAGNCRAAYRNYSPADYNQSGGGFRFARTSL